MSREGVAAAEEENRLSQGFYTHGLVPILNLAEPQAALAQARTSREGVAARRISRPSKIWS